MTKSPKMTNAARLDTLKKNGFVSNHVKTFNKSVRGVWEEFNSVFPNGRVFRKSTLVTVGNGIKGILKDSNMLVIGDKLVFPAEGAQVKVRETGKGIFIDAKRVTDATGRKIKNGPGYTIILAKNGMHIKYARELERKSGKKTKVTDDSGQVSTTYGTLKTSKLILKDGTTVKTFMRDMAMQYETIDGAIFDDRYNEGAADDIMEDDYGANRNAYMAEVAQANGVHAIIRMKI